MNAPQIIAIAVLVIEVIQAISIGRNNTIQKRGKDLFFDAIIWTALLIWGGFWK